MTGGAPLKVWTGGAPGTPSGQQGAAAAGGQHGGAALTAATGCRQQKREPHPVTVKAAARANPAPR